MMLRFVGTLINTHDDDDDDEQGHLARKKRARIIPKFLPWGPTKPGLTPEKRDVKQNAKL